MPVVSGETPHSDSRKDRDMGNVKLELAFRNESTEGAWKNDLFTQLKKHEQDGAHFKPRCPDADFEHMHLQG